MCAIMLCHINNEGDGEPGPPRNARLSSSMVVTGTIITASVIVISIISVISVVLVSVSNI